MTSLVGFCLSTNRLTLRPATDADLSDYEDINRDERVRQWIGDGSTLGADVTKAKVELWVKRVKENNPLIAYPVRLKSDGTFVGSVHFTASETPGIAELSYLFVFAHQNKKYCSEATAAFMYERVYDLFVGETVVQGALLQAVEATAREDNIPSNRVLKKLGFVFKKVIQKPGWQHPRLYYQLQLTSTEYITRVVSCLLTKMGHPLSLNPIDSVICEYLA